MVDATEAPTRPTERVKVFCRSRPLLQREREGWSFDEYVQHQQHQQVGAASDVHNCGNNDGSAEPRSPHEPTPTFLTEKGARCASGDACVRIEPDGKCVTFISPTTDSRMFRFDASLDESAGQESVYQRVAYDVVQDVLDGYNGTVLAYGQTSTGKTHTMVGKDNADDGDARGIIPRALEHIFDRVEQSKARDKTAVAMSYVQIYCERIFDLLDPGIAPSGIVVREDPERGVYLDGASVVSVASAGDCLELLRRGSSNRAVASTAMNDHSSRSHAVLILRIERKELAAANGDVSDPPRQLVKLSNLLLVDLAGSERVNKSRATGRHVSELKAINLSLSALGNCISALSNQHKHVPYRDSKLTRLLQSSLGGNAKTALVVTVTKSPTDAQETLSTLQFGQRAMQVAVRAQRNVLSVLDYRALYEDARQQLDKEAQRVRIAEGEQSEARARADALEDQLLKATIRIQHLKFENQAAKTVGSGGSSGVAGGEAAATMVEALVARHERDLAQIKRKCDQQVATYQKLADEAAQEWHEVENELTGEKTSALGYLQELKEFKLRFFQLEKDTAERIDELLQEQKERERERDAAALALEELEKETRALKQKARLPAVVLADAESERDRVLEQLDTDFVPRETIQQMEALYEGAISKLQDRVVSLENRAGSSKKLVLPAISAPSNNNNNIDRGRVNNNNSNNNDVPERVPPSNGRAIPKIGRIVPASKAGSASNVLR